MRQGGWRLALRVQLLLFGVLLLFYRPQVYADLRHVSVVDL